MSNINNVQDLVISSYDITNAASAVSDWLNHADNHADQGSALAVPVGVLTKKYNDLDDQADTIKGMLNEIMNGASAELDNFKEIITIYESSDNYLQDKLDNAEINITEEITEASGADFSRLSTLEVDLEKIIDDRRAEASGNINTFYTSISAQITAFTEANQTSVAAVFNGEFGGDGVTSDSLSIKYGNAKFDCSGEEINVQSGKAFHAFELTNHCVIIGKDSNDLVFKSLKKGGDGQQKEILRLHQSVVSALSNVKSYFYSQKPVIIAEYDDRLNQLDGKTVEEQIEILNALHSKIDDFREFCSDALENAIDNGDVDEFTDDLGAFIEVTDNMKYQIETDIGSAMAGMFQ